MNQQAQLEKLHTAFNNASSPAKLYIARTGQATLAMLAKSLIQKGKHVLILAKNREQWAEIKALLTLFSPDLSADSLPRDFDKAAFASLSPFTERSLHREAWAERLYAMYAMTHLGTKCLVLTVDNLLLKMPSLDFFDKHECTLRQGEEWSCEMLLDELISWGYERVNMLSSVGEVARRGDILDIFPPGYEKPVRIDFFGDTIEEIRAFHPSSQRSLETLKSITLLPVLPIRKDKEKDFAKHIEALFQKAAITENEHFGLSRLLSQRDPRLFPACVNEEAKSMSSWLPKDAVWLVPDKDECKRALQKAYEDWEVHFEGMADADRPQPLRMALQSPESIWEEFEKAESIETGALQIKLSTDEANKSTEDSPEKLSFNEKTLRSFTELFPMQEDRERPWNALVAALRSWQKDKEQVILSFGSERSRAKFLTLAEQDGLLPFLRYTPEKKGLFALVSPFRQGADLAWASSIVLGEDVLQPHAPKQVRKASKAFKGLDRYDNLVEGDILVHRDYGLAKFMGLVRMDLQGVANDFMLLHYAGDDKVYVPVDRLSLVQRFKGSGELVPALDKLGSSAWVASKEKAKKAIEKIAEDLVEMYAWRKTAKGYSYPPVGDLYREFEASFGFEETPDQAKAIQDVIMDMGKSEPMDRLVCGDVGFGKTEVALRAAFYAASEGRQVAILCPTTVLAEQHFQTFKSRVAGFALNVGLLSRFVSPKKQKETLQAASTGQLDILIGTHRLISKDVHLPNLGLLVLDEEQRFGVRHKEKLKEFKKNVDVLTLTATPIPRTLQLSMSGVRELSVIETAPAERKAVATALIERDEYALRKILQDELQREGQVFWVHNRVKGLEQVVSYVQSLVPEARVAMAHGQLPENQLEEAMRKFWRGEIDVLVCTAIVESGLDFPRANTLIIDQPQLFGLGQLYQLRGRVGRSDRQAYAYFVVSNIETLSSISLERFRIILELDYLGAGFQLAMEDLRLRGAGNILGEVQSGHMTRLGLDLYLEMLEQAVEKVKHGETSIVPETELQLGIPAYIPESYMASGQDRLRWYKRLSSAQDESALSELELELKDRYGNIPPELQVFIAVLLCKQSLHEMEALKADILSHRIRITWPDRPKKLDLQKLLAFVAKNPNKAKLVPPTSLEIRFEEGLGLDLALHDVRESVLALRNSSA